MSPQDHLASLTDYITGLPPVPVESFLVGHTLRIERDAVAALVATHQEQREYFFFVDPTLRTLTLNDLELIVTGTGTRDEHDSTVDALQFCGHTHPSVNRSMSPPSSYDVHAMVHAIKRAIQDEQYTGLICCSHLVVAPEGVYMITVHPVWAAQEDALIDWTLHEQYQSFDVLTGGVPETRTDPVLTISAYQAMTHRMGVSVQFEANLHDGIELEVYTTRAIRRPWPRMYSEPPVPVNRPRQIIRHMAARQLRF